MVAIGLNTAFQIATGAVTRVITDKLADGLEAGLNWITGKTEKPTDPAFV